MKEKILGGIFGLAIADAVGVPYEFRAREEMDQRPAADMFGYGTHDQPPGTWSDDTSMTLCLLDSLSGGVDYSDIMQRFLSWLGDCAYTAHDEVFDVGKTCREAVLRFAQGTPALSCGGTAECENGNGALMRILPLAFYLHSRFGKDFFRQEEAVAIIHNVAALTHAHRRNLVACGLYVSVAEMLLNETDLRCAVEAGIERAWQYYSQNAACAGELHYYERLREAQFAALPRTEIRSSGYVVDTLEAALWCLLNAESYRECVLKAVNLGEDTDTVAAVAGGLAGMHYGFDAIPPRWRRKLVKAEFIEELCDSFSRSLPTN